MLRRGAPKLDENGKPMRDAHGKVIYEPYHIKVLNTINFKKSMKYNKGNRGSCTSTHYVRVDFLEQVVLGEIR